MESCHRDGNRTNARLGNLRWDTKEANEADKIRHGTSNRGERNGQAKLTKEGVLSVISRLEDGETQRRIARELDLNQATISDIMTGRSWGWATGRGGDRGGA
jgi:DNA-binding NarL/FixJ family response regulator